MYLQRTLHEPQDFLRDVEAFGFMPLSLFGAFFTDLLFFSLQVGSLLRFREGLSAHSKIYAFRLYISAKDGLEEVFDTF